MTCTICGQAFCVCTTDKPTKTLPPIHGYHPLQSGPYVTMDEALADQPELLAKLKKWLTA